MKKIVILCIIIGLLFSGMINAVGVSYSFKNENTDVPNNMLNIQSDNPDFYTHYYSQRYAMIVIGEYQTDQHYTWFLKAAQKLYNVLTSEKYGFTQENVFVLLTFKNEWEEPDIFDNSIVDYKANESNIQNVLNSFKNGGENEISIDGCLFFTFIDHGNNDVFGLEGKDSVSAEELKNYVGGIKGRNIFVLQPCFSGSFVDNLAQPGRIVCTSVGPLTMEGGWIESFTDGLNGITQSDHPNGAIDSRPSDGIISLEEAFYQAAAHVRDDGIFGKYSRIDDNADGEGYGPYWNGPNDDKYGLDDLTVDGYKASRVYYLMYEEFLLDAEAKASVDKKTVEFEGHSIGGNAPYSWHWDFGDGFSSDEQNPTHEYEKNGDYDISLTVTDSNDDIAEDTIKISVTKAKYEKHSASLLQSFILKKLIDRFSLLSLLLLLF